MDAASPSRACAKRSAEAAGLPAAAEASGLPAAAAARADAVAPPSPLLDLVSSDPIGLLVKFFCPRTAMRFLQAIDARVPPDARAPGVASGGEDRALFVVDELTRRVVNARELEMPSMFSLLEESVVDGSLQSVAWLLARGASVAEACGSGKSLLKRVASGSGASRTAIVDALCKAASDDARCGDMLKSALTSAIFWQNVDMVAVLLKHGQRISVEDAFGANLLHNKYLVIDCMGGRRRRRDNVFSCHVYVQQGDVTVDLYGNGFSSSDDSRSFDHDLAEGDTASLDAALAEALDHVIAILSPRVASGEIVQFNLCEAFRDGVPFDELRDDMAKYLRVDDSARAILQMVLAHPPPDEEMAGSDEEAEEEDEDSEEYEEVDDTEDKEKAESDGDDEVEVGGEAEA